MISLFSNDLVAKVEYPNQSTGTASTSASDDVSYTFDLQGDVLTKTDQNQSTHTYTYDLLGRPILDAVTALGTGVDGSILALGYNYNALGLPYQQTSYSDSAATSAVNQVQDVYNYGQLTTQYQEHSGAVNTATSPSVQYGYSQPSGANYSRLSSMTYPNGRVLDYVYNSGIDTNISRVSALSDDSATGAGSVEAYTYLGLDTIVQRSDGNGIQLTYIKQSGESNGAAGDQYTGLDAFGRVIDQRWIPVSSPTTPTDRFQYAYDRDGNVLYKNNLVKSAFSELYHSNSSTSGDDNKAYDNLNRLQAFRRGTLSSSGHNGAGLDTVATLNSNANSSQSWALDAVGNQTAVTTDGTNKTNTLNSQNELTGFGTATLAFDANGNTTTDDQSHTLVYDAWNKLVTVKNGGATLAAYAYDANGNRITQTDAGFTSELYNSAAGQVLEERQSSTTTNQYVWSLAYVNAPVLRDDNSTGGSYGKSGSGLGRRLYAQEDANFDVTALTNTSGVVQQRLVYTPYGVSAVIDGTTSWGTTTNLLSWVYTFQGGRYNDSSRMIHFGAREYIPAFGRWSQRDPLSGGSPSNLYRLEESNPSTNVDPHGTISRAQAKADLQSAFSDLSAAMQALNALMNVMTATCDTTGPMYSIYRTQYDLDVKYANIASDQLIQPPAPDTLGNILAIVDFGMSFLGLGLTAAGWRFGGETIDLINRAYTAKGVQLGAGETALDFAQGDNLSGACDLTSAFLTLFSPAVACPLYDLLLGAYGVGKFTGWALSKNAQCNYDNETCAKAQELWPHAQELVDKATAKYQRAVVFYNHST